MRTRRLTAALLLPVSPELRQALKKAAARLKRQPTAVHREALLAWLEAQGVDVSVLPEKAITERQPR